MKDLLKQFLQVFVWCWLPVFALVLLMLVALAVRGEMLDKNRPCLSSSEPIEWTPLAPPKPYDVGTPITGLGLIADLLMVYNTHVNKAAVSLQLKNAATISDFLSIAKTVQPPATAPAADAGGNHYYGASLGQVRMRDPQGAWRTLDTGTVATITAVAVDGRRLIAGTSDGVIRVSDDLGKTWKNAGGITAGEPIVDIDVVGTQCLILSTRTQPGPINTVLVNQIQVHSVNRADFSDPRLLRSFALKDPLHSLQANGIRAQVLGGFYFVNTVEELARHDLNAKTWKNVSPGHAVALFDVEPETGLISTFRNQGVFSKLSTSTDNGDSWQDRETPPTVCPRTVHDVAHTQVFCVTASNSILKLGDGGQLAVEFAAN